MPKKKRFKIESFELLSHGFENEQYFQGCGATKNFKEVVTGCGPTEKAAFEDALSQIHKDGFDLDFTDIESGAGELSEAEYETNTGLSFGEEDEEDFVEPEEENHGMYFYYSIRYNV